MFLIGGPLTLTGALADATRTPSVEQAQSEAASELIDINTASVKELRTLPGIGNVYSQKIVEGRPYQAVDDLRTKKILPTGTFVKIQDKVTAKTQN